MPQTYIAALEAAEKRIEEAELYVDHVLIVNTEYKGQAIKFANEVEQLQTALNELRMNVPTCDYCKRNRYIINKALGRDWS